MLQKIPNYLLSQRKCIIKLSDKEAIKIHKSTNTGKNKVVQAVN